MIRFGKRTPLLIAVALLTLIGCKTFGYAGEGDEPERKLLDSGSSGSISWEFYDDNVLELSGTGSTGNYFDGDWEKDISNRSQSWYTPRNIKFAQKLIIKEGIEGIGSASFADFSFEEIEIQGNSLANIGDAAFYNCKNLKAIHIPEGVTYIGKKAFFNCSSLEAITIPGSVSVISEYAFTGLDGTMIKINNGLTIVGKKWFAGTIGRLDLPATVTDIDGFAIPEDTTWELLIGRNEATRMFAERCYIPYVDANEKVTIVDNKALSIAPASKSFEYTGKEIKPEITTKYSSNSSSAPLVKDVDYVLSYSNNIERGTAKVTATAIGYFTGNISWDFEIYGNMKDAVITLEYDSVAYDKKAHTPAVSATYAKKPLVLNKDFSVSYSSNKKIGTATVKVTGIGYMKGSAEETFDIFEPKIFDYGDFTYAISGLSDTVHEVRIIDSDIDTKVVKVPKRVKYEDEYYKVVEISRYSFKNEKLMTKLILNSNVRVIGEGVFQGCSNLKEITGTNGLVKIGNKAFYGCKKLPKITLSESLTSIGKQAFYNCSKLKSITIKSTSLSSSTVGSKAFQGVNSKAVIKVNSSCVSKYKTLFKSKGFKKSGQKVKAFK